MNYPNFQLTPGSVSAALAIAAPVALAVFGKFQLLNPLVQATFLVVSGLVVAAYLVSRAIVAAAHKQAVATITAAPLPGAGAGVLGPTNPDKTVDTASEPVVLEPTAENPDNQGDTAASADDVDKTRLVPGSDSEVTPQ